MLFELHTVRMPDGSADYTFSYPHCEITVYADAELSKQALMELAHDMEEFASQNGLVIVNAIVDRDGVCTSCSGI